MMKRLLIITVLIFGVLVAFGQKNVSDKENETAPKTALIEAQKDYQKAVKEKKFSITDSIINPPDQIPIFN